MNVALDNVGSTVQFTKSIDPDVGKKPIDLKTLVDEMLAGQVDVLIVFDTNPVYSAGRYPVPRSDPEGGLRSPSRSLPR